MRLASLMQKPKYGATAMNAETVFRLATIEGAKALNLENEIGSIEVGKKADLVLINLNETNHPMYEHDGNVYSRLVYSETGANVKHVMIDGKWVVKEGKSQPYDQNKMVAEGKKQLRRLLSRI